MRTLFVIGIVSIVVLIAWLLFLNYDMTRFKSELFVNPVAEQGSKDGSNEAFIQSDDTRESLENARTAIQSTDTLESLTFPMNTDIEKVTNTSDMIDTGSELRQIGLQPKLTDTGISPKLMKLFTMLGPLNKGLDEIYVELTPLHDQRLSVGNRRREIIEQIGEGNLDQATVRTLYAELEEINTLNAESGPRIFELQDQARQIEERQLTFLEEYGYTSWEEFLNPHGETYFNWYSKQTNE